MGSVESSVLIMSRISQTRSPQLIGSEKLLVELEVPKNEPFHFFHIFRSTEKFNFSPEAMVSENTSQIISVKS